MQYLTLALLALAVAVFGQTNLVAIDGGFPNILYTFANVNPAPVTARNVITGLASGEQLLSLATFPSTQGDVIYGLSSTSKVYSLNPVTAQASNPVQLSCAPSASATNPTLSTDFNPNNGLLAILVAQNGNFYLANITTGACFPQQMARLPNSAATPNTAGLAHRFNGANSQPTLFTPEALTKTLYTINPNTGGNLTAVGNGLGTTLQSGVGGFAIVYGNVSQGIATLYNQTLNTSAIYTIDLNSGVATNTANLTIFTNLLGLAVRNNAFPNGVIGIPPSGGNGGNTGNNGNNGNLVFNGQNVTGSATLPVPLTTTSYSTTANLQGTNGAASTDVITVLAPSGTASYTKTISDSGPGVSTTNIRVATVYVGGTSTGSNAGGYQQFTENVVLNLAGPTITDGATIRLPAGKSTATAVVTSNDSNGNSVTTQATVLIGAADVVTIPQLSLSRVPNGGTVNAVVTVGDTNGQTATQLATLQLDTARLGQFLSSASMAQVSVALIVVVSAILVTI